MTITQVRTHRLSVPLHTPFETALRRTSTLDTLIVEIVDEDGQSGYGEAPQVWAVTGASVAGACACVEDVLGPLLIGRAPDELLVLCALVRRAVVGNEAAKSAVDTAMHDLAARRMSVPLVRWLGGADRRVRTDVTLALGATEDLAKVARRRVGEGFTVLKLKVGADASNDLDRVREVCSAVGPQVRVRLDANQGWTPREAVRVIRGIEDGGLGVEFVEQPVARWDLDGLAWVHDRVDLPIMADESVFDARDLVSVIQRRAADLVNVKLAKCGGLRAARTLLDLCGEYGIGTMIGSMMETTVGVTAAASLAAAYGTDVVCDLDAAWWLNKSPVRGGAAYDNGDLTLPDQPGLGIFGLTEPA